MHPFIKLARLDHGLMAVIATLAAYFYVSTSYEPTTILALAVATLGSEIFLFTTNDIFNIEEDRVNRPDAPLVKGEVSAKAAWAYAISSLVVGLLLTSTLGVKCLAIYLAANTIGFAYNAKLKRVPLLGNLLVATTTSMTFPFGAAAGGGLSDIIVVSIFAISLLANLGREIAKCVRDYEGDLRAGVRTIAHVLGLRRASLLSVSIIVLAVIASTSVLVYSTSVALRISVIITDVLLAVESARYLRELNAEAFRRGTLRAFSVTLLGLFLSATTKL